MADPFNKFAETKLNPDNPKVKQCRKCGVPFKMNTIGKGNKAMSFYFPACNCMDKEIQADRIAEQEKDRRQKYQALILKSNLPERCRETTYEIPTESEYAENGDDILTHLEYSKFHRFLREPELILSTYSGVFICGNAGTRKTTYSCELAKRVMMMGKSVNYFQCAEIVTKKVFIYENIKTDFLILDDLGNSSIETRDNLLWTLVNKRIDAKKFTIIITNFSDSHNREMHGEPFMDRLKLFYPIAMIGQSSRKSG